MSALYRVHKRAQASNKITSLYIIDAIARAAKKEAKGSHKGKEKDDGSQASSFLQKLEAVLGKIVSHNWEEGLPEHRVRSSRRPPLRCLHVLIYSTSNDRKKCGACLTSGARLLRSARLLCPKSRKACRLMRRLPPSQVSPPSSCAFSFPRLASTATHSSLLARASSLCLTVHAGWCTSREQREGPSFIVGRAKEKLKCHPLNTHR